MTAAAFRPEDIEISVKTRMIAFRFFKQVRMSFPPLVQSLKRRGMTEISLRNIGIIDNQMSEATSLQAAGRIQNGSVEQLLEFCR